MAKRRNERGRLFLRGKSKRWYCQYYVDGKQIIARLLNSEEKPCASREEAIAARDRLLAPLLAGDRAAAIRQVAHALQDAETAAAAMVEDSKPRLKLAEVWSLFPYETSSPRRGRVARRLSPANIKQNQYGWDRFTDFMEKRHSKLVNMEDVTIEHAQEYSRYLRDVRKVSDHRHNMLVQIAGVMFRRAGRRDPFETVTRYAAKHATRENLEVPELKLICGEATGELRILFALALYTGLRMGDCVTMEWGKHVKLEHGRLIRTTAKTGAEVSFPIHPELLAVLAETPADKRTGYVCPELAALYLRDRASLSKKVRKHFEAVKKAHEELKGFEIQKDMGKGRKAFSLRGMHSFRHSFVTICARAGVPVGAISQWVGHSPLVDRIYQHWQSKETDARILNALPTMTETAPALPAATDTAAAQLEQVVILAKSCQPDRMPGLLEAMRAYLNQKATGNDPQGGERAVNAKD